MGSSSVMGSSRTARLALRKTGYRQKSSLAEPFFRGQGAIPHDLTGQVRSNQSYLRNTDNGCDRTLTSLPAYTNFFGNCRATLPFIMTLHSPALEVAVCYFPVHRYHPKIKVVEHWIFKSARLDKAARCLQLPGFRRHSSFT